jgi:type II secretory pathway predicted ATPase ExeA
MTGEQRLAVALDLHELSCDIAREGIRRQNPRADAAEVERLLRHRLELARAA